MKISYNWLKLYIDIDVDPEELSKILTDCGLEVEGLEKTQSVRGGLEGVLIGEVITSEKHPNADRLTLTTVDVGKENLLRIVCGAPNVRAGQKVPVATVGSILYDGDQGFEIKRSKIRGKLSEGMICAEDELGLGASHEGIMVLDPGAKVGMTAKEFFKISEDWVFEIGLTPNRTDAMSHIGVARDVKTVLNNLDTTEDTGIQLQMPSVADYKSDYNGRAIEVIVEDTEACPRYSGVTMTDITVGESPDWLKNYLSTIGVRPINNIVDISNWVLFETGQPLHIFDADKIAGDKVIVRKPAKGTKFITLDEVERELSGNDLMICNVDEGMCIGGVFGGLKSGVTGETKNIFIEAANFDARTIRKTSKYHGLQTDSSFRFERGVDPNGTIYAIKRSAMLITELAGGRISSEIEDIYPSPVGNHTIEVFFENIQRLIGKEIPENMVVNILNDLGIEILSRDSEKMLVSVPPFKVEVTREADIIEEILRIYGYNNIEIPDAIRSSLSFSEKPDKVNVQNTISDMLSSNGYFEIMNNSLTNSRYLDSSETLKEKENVVILNPISQDLDVLRQTLLFGGLESIGYNLNRKNSDIRMYEFGTVYKIKPDTVPEDDILKRFDEEQHLSLLITGNREKESWYQTINTVDFFELKSFVHRVLYRLGIDLTKVQTEPYSSDYFESGIRYSQGTKTLVEVGELKRDVLQRFEIKQDVFYAEFNWGYLLKQLKSSRVDYTDLSRYPEVRRDLALLIKKDVQFEEIVRIALKTEKNILRKVNLFDVFEDEKIGKDKKSYAVSFILQDQKKTLTDREIDKVMNKLIRAYQDQLGAVIR